MHCPNCGAILAEGSRFCNNCGHSFSGQPAAVPLPPYGVPMRPAKDPSTGMLIEIVGTLFGFMGLGWLYAGYTNRGIAALLIWLGVVVVAAIISVFTGGLFACLWVPVQIVAAIVSGSQVKNTMIRDSSSL